MKTLIILLVLLVGQSNAQSFSLPAGVEGLIKGPDFEIQGECKCATIYYTTEVYAKADEKHTLKVFLDNSMKWDDGDKHDKFSERVIIKLLDLLVEQRFPQYEHWQGVLGYN